MGAGSETTVLIRSVHRPSGWGFVVHVCGGCSIVGMQVLKSHTCHMRGAHLATHCVDVIDLVLVEDAYCHLALVSVVRQAHDSTFIVGSKPISQGLKSRPFRVLYSSSAGQSKLAGPGQMMFLRHV